MRQVSIREGRSLGFFAMLACVLLLIGCGPSTPYVRPDSVTKTTDFSDTDLRMNAEAMVNSLTAGDFLHGLEDKPILAVAGIQNRTMQHIDTMSLENTIQTALFRSGMFRFVDREILQQAAREKALVDLRRIDVADAVELGNVLGADYFLFGYLSGIDTQHGRRSVHYTKLTMKAVDVHSSEVVWMDEKEIKKASRKRF